MAEDAGSIFSEVRLRLDKLDADIKHAINAMNEFGTKLVDISDRTANLFDKPYAQSIAKVESYIRSLAQAAEKGAISEKQAIEETIAVRKRQLDFIAASAAKQGGYTDKQIADVKATKLELERLELQYKELGFAADSSGKKQIGVFEKLSSALGAAAIVQAFRAAIAGFVEYDSTLTDVQAATRATEDDLRALEQAAKDAGKTTAFSAKEALKGIEALSKAGVSNADIMGGALTGALSLAAAGSLEVGIAAETAAAAMTQFGLTGRDASHVADLLAAAAGKSQGEVNDYAQALNQVGLVAAQTGLTIEETTAALAEFGAVGLKGSDAGTSFRTMLLALTGNSVEAKEKMAELGISAFDAQGKFVGLEKFAGILHESLKDLTEEERLKNMKVIFGQDAIRAASILYKEGAAGIRDWSAKVNDAGFAAETARIQNESLAGHLKKLSSAAENASNSFVEKLSPALKGLADIGTSVLNFVAGLPGPVQAAVAVFAVLSGGLLAAALAARGLGVALSASLGPIGLAVAAIAGIATGIATANAEAKEFAKNEAATTFKSIAAQSGKTGEELDKFIEKLADVDSLLKDFGRHLNEEGMRNLARETGLTSKQFADLILLSKNATDAQKAYANQLLATIDRENELNDLRAESAQRQAANIRSQTEANREAEAKRIQALAGISAAIAYQNKLIDLGIITEEEGLNNKIKLRQAEIDKIIDIGRISGSLNSAQIAEIEKLKGLNEENAASLKLITDAQEKAIETEKELERQRSAAADKLQTDTEAITAEYEKSVSIIENITKDRISALEKERDELLKIRLTEEERVAVVKHYQDQIDAIGNESVEKERARQKTLRSIISDSNQRTTEESIASLDEKEEALRKAGATEVEIAEFVSRETERIQYDSFIRQFDAVKNYVSQVSAAFQGLISALAELFAAGNEIRLAEIQEQQDAALASIDAQLQAELEAAGVADETAKERAERQLSELEARLAAETDADKRAALQEEITAAKKAVTKADIEQKYADKVAETNRDFENKKLQQQYEGELAAWGFKLAGAIAQVPVSVINAMSAGWQAGLPAGPVLAVALGAAAGAAGAIQIGHVIASKPKPPVKLQTGGIVLPQQGGVPVVAAENGSPELFLNGGSSGQALLGQFASMISDKMGGGGPITLQLVVDGRVMAETTAPYFEKGIVRLKL